METLCKIRDIYRSIAEFETRFEQAHQLCLNEGMLLCSLKSGRLTSGEMATQLGLTASNTSKVIRSVETKGLIERVTGRNDKRQMYFSLTKAGKKRLAEIQCDKTEIPDILKNIVTGQQALPQPVPQTSPFDQFINSKKERL